MFGSFVSTDATNISIRADGMLWSDQAWALNEQRNADIRARIKTSDEFAAGASDRQKRMKELLGTVMAWHDAWEFVMLLEEGRSKDGGEAV